MGLNGVALGDLAVFELTATSQVTLGQQVDWEITVSVSGFQTPANNHGIDSIAVDLDNTGVDALSVGAISPSFSDYSTTSGGTVSGTSLVEIGAVLFVQNNAVAEAIDPAISGSYVSGSPIVLAAGSFTPTQLGTFNLNITAGSANSFFTTAGGSVGAGEDFDLSFISDTYEVVTVPEPGGMALIGLTLLAWSVKRERRA